MLAYRISPRAREELHSTSFSIFKPNPEYILKQSGLRAWNRVFSSFRRRVENFEIIYLSRSEILEKKPRIANLLGYCSFPDGPVYIILSNVLKKMGQCSLDPFLQLVYLHAHEFVHANDFLGPLGELNIKVSKNYGNLQKARIISIKKLMGSQELFDFALTFEEARAVCFEQMLADEDRIGPAQHKQWFTPFNGNRRRSFKGIGVLDYVEFIRRLEILERVGVWNKLEPRAEEISHPALFEARISKLYNNVRNSDLFLDNVLLFPLSKMFYLDKMMS